MIKYLLDELIKKAKESGISLDDLFLPSTEICNPGQFLYELTEEMTDGRSWINKAIERVERNQPGDKFYDALAGFVAGEPYQKLEPAKYIIRDGNKEPADGRHRAVLCQKLNFPLPVEEL